MDEHHFETLIRSMSGGASRRGMMHRLIAAGLGLAGIRHGQTGAKTRKRKRARRNAALRLNAYGCLDVGRPCRGDSTLCCSGVCEGSAPHPRQRDRSRCVAHNTGGCRLEQDACSGVDSVPCGTDGTCVRTTGNAPFCFIGPGLCTDCARDADCEPLFGPGAACIFCEGDCADGSGLICVAPATV